MHFAFGEHRFLLASDISASVEMHIAQTFPDLACDLLLVPHHGSNRSNSLEFIDKVRPSWAVVSCGTDNAQGLPHPDVLARYEKAGAKVLRTDLHGLVRVTSDGRKIRKETFVRDSSE
jgi:competence protein ComEC